MNYNDIFTAVIAGMSGANLVILFFNTVELFRIKADLQDIKDRKYD